MQVYARLYLETYGVEESIVDLIPSMLATFLASDRTFNRKLPPEMSGSDHPDRLLKLDEVKRRVELGKSMIYRLIQEGKFPSPYKVSPFASRWSDREIVAWVDDVKDGFEGKKRKV